MYIRYLHKKKEISTNFTNDRLNYFSQAILNNSMGQNYDTFITINKLKYDLTINDNYQSFYFIKDIILNALIIYL